MRFTIEECWKEYEEYLEYDDLEMAYICLGDVAWYYVPNCDALYCKYQKIVFPYSKKTLPNLRKIPSCYNCKHADKMFCGSHIEWSCGITIDYVSRYDMVCDLHEFEEGFDASI